MLNVDLVTTGDKGVVTWLVRDFIPHTASHRLWPSPMTDAGSPKTSLLSRETNQWAESTGNPHREHRREASSRLHLGWRRPGTWAWLLRGKSSSLGIPLQSGGQCLSISLWLSKVDIEIRSTFFLECFYELSMLIFFFSHKFLLLPMGRVCVTIQCVSVELWSCHLPRASYFLFNCLTLSYIFIMNFSDFDFHSSHPIGGTLFNSPSPPSLASFVCGHWVS